MMNEVIDFQSEKAKRNFFDNLRIEFISQSAAEELITQWLTMQMSKSDKLALSTIFQYALRLDMHQRDLDLERKLIINGRNTIEVYLKCLKGRLTVDPNNTNVIPIQDAQIFTEMRIWQERLEKLK